MYCEVGEVSDENLFTSIIYKFEVKVILADSGQPKIVARVISQ